MIRQPCVVYIQADVHVQVTKSRVNIGDVVCVYCKDKAVEEEIKNIPLMKLDADDAHKHRVSVLSVIDRIETHCLIPLIVQSTGENEFLVSKKPQKRRGIVLWCKMAFVALVTFFGSAFAIMTYNEDVDVNGVFDKIYEVVTDKTRQGPGVLEGGYAIGAGIGIIVFFNHFGRKKLNDDPTPMEIEMEKYEKDINTTMLNEASKAKEGP